MRRIAPVGVVLCLQAFLLLYQPNLLAVWDDELSTYGTVARPVGQIIRGLQWDVHPPLYFVLLHGWAQLRLPWQGIAALRAFSALWALAATLLLDLLWTRRWRPWRRWLALSLFALSPCLLLYGRMARSYAMQTALALLAASLLWRWLRHSDSPWRSNLGALAAMTALLYTHYIPGIALLVALCAVGWRRLGAARLGWFLAAVSAGYLPWVPTLIRALRTWGGGSGFTSQYALTGNAFTEQFLKIGFGLVSFTIGETFAAVCLGLVPVALALAWRGARLNRRLGVFIGLAAGVGYLGVARWESYPFVPGRLLWLLPFVSLAIAAGIWRLRGLWRQTAAAALMLSYLWSAALYFRREDFLNPGYSAPLREIAERLNREAGPGDVILMDAYNTDHALRYYLSGRTPVLILNAGAVKAARARLAGGGSVWMVRNTHDISPGHISSRIEAEACAGRVCQKTFLHPCTALQVLAMRLLGGAALPPYFYQLTVCRARGG
ncbi:MAG: hypothetical protein ABSH05_20145 [Bryobacteraceae bacterium]|jgi:uncharacterized membrane protein